MFTPFAPDLPPLPDTSDRLHLAKHKLSNIAANLTFYLESFEEEFPELKIDELIRVDRIDVRSSGNPDKEIIHRVIIRATVKS